jgi:hypothetical protein
VLAAKVDAKAQASKAAKAVKKGTFKRARKPRYSVVFHRPKTLQRTRAPKYPRTRWAQALGFTRASALVNWRQENGALFISGAATGTFMCLGALGDAW